MHYYCGVDIGASAAKLVIIDEKGKLKAKAIRNSGVNYAEVADRCLAEALTTGAVAREEIKAAVSTGYGRNNVPWVTDTMTEIACHGKGAWFHFQKEVTVIDIGAQDSKVIRITKEGRRTNFKMNRKCAAGTGAFLEEIARRLDLPVAELNGLAERSTREVKLGSFCTVFTATEILERIREGEKVEDIVKGAFRSVVKRILEMDTIESVPVMTGGVVAHNPLLATLAGESFGEKVLVPPDPQYTGALGAALFALERDQKGE